MNTREAHLAMLEDVIETVLREWSAAVEPTLKGPAAVQHRAEMRAYRTLTEEVLACVEAGQEEQRDKLEDAEEASDLYFGALLSLSDAVKGALKQKRGWRKTLRAVVDTVGEVA